MKIPENLKVQTKSGLDIYFEIETFIKPVASDKWDYHKIEAYTDINNEKVNVGYITIAYISEEKREKDSKDIINYAIKNGKIDYRTKNIDPNLNASTITMEDINKILSGRSFSNDTLDSEKISFFKVIMKFDNLKNYESHLKYHYLKPEAHYIQVNDDFRRKGIGIELYKKAIELCNLNGLNFYQSTTQTVEAIGIWDYMKKSLGNCGAYEYKSYKGETRNRFYFGNEKPILEFDNGLKKITIKSLSKQKIKPF